MEPDDFALMRQLQEGEDEALEKLMDRYKEAIFGFAFRQTFDASAAADVTQETFVRVYLNRLKFRPTGSFRSWLYRIASNLCVDRARRARRAPTANVIEPIEREGGGSILETLEAAGPSPADAAAREGEIADLKAEIALLPAALREPLVLFALEERSQQECAEILGVSAKAVEAKVARAKAVLRDRLAKLWL